MELKVKKDAALMDFLLGALDGKSRTSVKAMLAKRLVSVEGKVTTQFNHIVSAGQSVFIGKRTPLENVELNGVRIVYDDDDLVVIEKSAGILSVPTDTGKERTAHGITAGHLKRINPRSQLHIVHRLDRDTSGLMMFVKKKQLQVLFRSNWQENVMVRSYSVVVEGVVEKDKDTIISWLKGTDDLRSYSVKENDGGQKAISRYTVIKRSNDFSLLDVELETGRKNQIRVHMQDIGHPVVGDAKYGATTNVIGRLGLHARVLVFTHPVTQKQMSFEAKPPGEFLRLFRKTSPTSPS